jgi:hypothetical protein
MTDRKLILAAGAVCALLLAAPVTANDSSAELSQGGLVLTKHAGIEMKSEDLYISAKEIRVKYRFLNTLPADQKIIVAFPMPDITIEGEDDNLAIPTENPVNFMDFHTSVDGRPVAAEVEQKAVKNGVDRTALLKRLGVPLAPQLQATGKALDALPKAAKDEILKLHMADIEEYDVGHGMEKHLGPRWTLKTTYFWTQIFPAGRELAVEHRYKPSVGETSGTMLEEDASELKSNSYYATMRKRFCIDDDFMAAIARHKAEVGAQHQAFFEKRIEYVLKTGANWKSPIGDFRLTLDKGEPGNLLSVCETGIRKSGPTTFEIRRTNYLPDHDLKILILVGPPAGM